jgi:leucyl/phenylalanyl-tRNA--protein transferase
MPIFWLQPGSLDFPPPELADDRGILAIGGDLSVERLLRAYRMGLFPWYNPGEPILWWTPDPRMVLFPEELKVSKSMRPYFNQQKFQWTLDHDFQGVIEACREIRLGPDGQGTWISDEIVEAYTDLHELGYAHSVEVWEGDELVGGLYGLAIGKIFFGESMFARRSNASKFGFISLVQYLREKGFWLVDCQQETPHLASLGARPIPRATFMEWLAKNEQEPDTRGKWTVGKE